VAACVFESACLGAINEDVLSAEAINERVSEGAIEGVGRSGRGKMGSK